MPQRNEKRYATKVIGTIFLIKIQINFWRIHYRTTQSSSRSLNREVSRWLRESLEQKSDKTLRSTKGLLTKISSDEGKNKLAVV